MPLMYYANNVGGTANLLKACSDFGCKYVVFSSSCATYGNPTRLPLTETHSQQPINPYGYTKLIIEQMLRHAEMAHGIKHVVLRYFNAAGADPDGQLGEVHRPETHLLPLALFAALGREGSIKIFGSDYPTNDGTCVRDYVHVTDLAAAHVAAVDWLSSGNNSDVFNLGNGLGFSVMEIVAACQRITGKKIKVEICGRREGDPPVLISDSTKARQFLRWCPRFPNIDDQIEHAWRWFCSAP
jgi:UDP-glucose-4-epimerase GalE